MISTGLIDLVQCPDCGHTLDSADGRWRCGGCRRDFETGGGYLDLRPRATFTEQTKYLDHALHTDARHERIAPPVLGSKIRNDMLQRFLQPAPGDRIADLGCGSGRTIAWNARTGAHIVGVDVSPFFAADAVRQADLVLGDLRALPFRTGVFHKAWSLDVMEHLSREALHGVLTEAHRVLAPDGALFIYTHVRRNGWPAAGVRAVNRLARLFERVGLLDLTQERLRKSDHLNPVADHDDWMRITGDCGFTVERITYYSPVVGAFMENVVARVVERTLARRAARRAGGTTDASPERAVKLARQAAQARVERRGATYWALRAATGLMAADVAAFGRIKSGPFFALLRRQPDDPRA